MTHESQDHSDTARRQTEKDSRFKVVLFPLSLCPSSKTLTSCFTLFSFFSALIMSSILSLTRFASSSACNLLCRSSGDSFSGGRRAAARGSDSDLRRWETADSVFCLGILRWEGIRRGEGGLGMARIKANRDHSWVFSPKKILFCRIGEGHSDSLRRPRLVFRTCTSAIFYFTYILVTRGTCSPLTCSDICKPMHSSIFLTHQSFGVDILTW